MFVTVFWYLRENIKLNYSLGLSGIHTKGIKKQTIISILTDVINLGLSLIESIYSVLYLLENKINWNSFG